MEIAHAKKKETTKAIQEAKKKTNMDWFKRCLNAQNGPNQEPSEEATAAEPSEEDSKPKSVDEAEDERNADPVDQPGVAVEQDDTIPIIPNLDVLDDEELLDEDLSDDKTEPTIMNRYLKAIQKRLQYELSKDFPAMERTWLCDLLNDNDWWIPQHKYSLICQKLEIPFEEEEKEAAYFRKVYVWLPDVRWGQACGMPACGKCCSNSQVGNNGFQNNHFGRRVVALDHDYYCLSRRYRCKKCEGKMKEIKKRIEERAVEYNIAIHVETEIHDQRKYTFMAWNRKTLELYPHGIGLKFPAFLTHKSGVDRLLLDTMRPLFDKGLRPGALADTILELHAKRYHQECLMHEI